MQKPFKPTEYLLLSRGKWAPEKSPEQIQNAIDSFYTWHEKLCVEGKMKAGHRLSTQGKLVSFTGVIDGPFTETKEVIGGFMILTADNYETAVRIAREFPAALCPGSSIELREISEQF